MSHDYTTQAMLLPQQAAFTLQDSNIELKQMGSTGQEYNILKREDLPVDVRENLMMGDGNPKAYPWNNFPLTLDSLNPGNSPVSTSGNDCNLPGNMQSSLKADRQYLQQEPRVQQEAPKAPQIIRVIEFLAPDGEKTMNQLSFLNQQGHPQQQAQNCQSSFVLQNNVMMTSSRAHPYVLPSGHQGMTTVANSSYALPAWQQTQQIFQSETQAPMISNLAYQRQPQQQSQCVSAQGQPQYTRHHQQSAIAMTQQGSPLGSNSSLFQVPQIQKSGAMPLQQYPHHQAMTAGHSQYMSVAMQVNNPYLRKEDPFIKLSAELLKNGGDKKMVGKYSRLYRLQKIMKYKHKQRLWRCFHPVTRVYNGRRRVAGVKPRVKGRFVKNAPEVVKNGTPVLAQ